MVSMMLALIVRLGCIPVPTARQLLAALYSSTCLFDSATQCSMSGNGCHACCRSAPGLCCWHACMPGSCWQPSPCTSEPAYVMKSVLNKWPWLPCCLSSGT